MRKIWLEALGHPSSPHVPYVLIGRFKNITAETGFHQPVASALCLLLCSDSYGAPRSSRTGEDDREVGILLGIEIEGASICPKIIGKAAGH
jgi:hypothetical protein